MTIKHSKLSIPHITVWWDNKQTHSKLNTPMLLYGGITDLDYADDVALLAELLHIVTHGLGVMSKEALLGL